MFDFLSALKPARIPADDGNVLAALTAQADRPQGIAVFVHGFTGSKEDFALILPDLAEIGWSCVAYDQRGHYESSAEGSFGIDDVAADALAVARWARTQFGEDLPVFLVGHSLGGLITQRAVALAPSLFALAVMICSGNEGVAAQGSTHNPVTVARLHEFQACEQGRSITQLWDEMARVQNVDMNNPFSKFLQERFVRSDKAAMVSFAAMLESTPNLSAGVLASKVPVRWCFGAEDGSWAQSQQQAAAARYGTQPVVIPDAMHSPMYENSEATVEVLDAFFRPFAAQA